MVINVLNLIYILLIITYLLLIYRDNVMIPRLIQKNKKRHKNLLVFLDKVQNILQEKEIIYWMIGGGLIGYIRHDKSLIPWDDDLDLGLLYTEDFENKILLFKKDIESLGYVLKNVDFGYKVVDIYNDVDIDLFIYIQDGSKIVFKYPFAKLFWPNDYFYINELFPLIDDYIDNVICKLPKEYKKFLIRAYGNNVLKEYKIFSVHKCNRIESMIYSYLKNFNYQVK